MIRKTVIALLTIGTLTSGVAWAMSEFRPMGFEVNPSCGASFVPTGWHLHPSSNVPVDLCIAGYDSKLHVEHVSASENDWSKWNRETAGVRYGVGLIHDNCFGEDEGDYSLRRVAFAAIPFSYITVTLALYPAGAFFLGPARRWRRRRQGRCSNCAYDLTGNESGFCPECGTELEQPCSADSSL